MRSNNEIIDAPYTMPDRASDLGRIPFKNDKDGTCSANIKICGGFERTDTKVKEQCDVKPYRMLQYKFSKIATSPRSHSTVNSNITSRCLLSKASTPISDGHPFSPSEQPRAVSAIPE